MISAVILTKNEEDNIEKCIKSVQWSDEIIVLDDNSDDETVKISEKLGAKVIKHSLNNDFSDQRNYGLEKANGEWVFFVDSDELVSENLANEIKSSIKDADVNGFYLRREDFFMARLLKHGEIGSIRLLRLARKNSGKWERTVDEVWKVKGQTKTLTNPLIHYSHPNLTQFLQNINQRSTMNARYLFETNKGLNFFEWCKPKLKFIDGYFLKKGFLDGLPGFVFAVLMSLHSFLVRGKLFILLHKQNTIIK